MVSHRAVDQFKDRGYLTRRRYPLSLTVENDNQLFFARVWDTIIDGQDLYAELKINHLESMYKEDMANGPKDSSHCSSFLTASNETRYLGWRRGKVDVSTV